MHSTLSTIARSVASIVVACTPIGVSAEELGHPAGEVLLTVTGAIEASNSEDGARFDLDMLRTLPVTRYETTTIWTDGVQVFEGALLRDVLEAVGATGSELRAVALNDYAITFPVDGEEEDHALIAYRMNGDRMSVRNKGPLWIVYPYDADAAFRTEIIYARSIWQLHRIEIR